MAKKSPSAPLDTAVAKQAAAEAEAAAKAAEGQAAADAEAAAKAAEEQAAADAEAATKAAEEQAAADAAANIDEGGGTNPADGKVLLVRSVATGGRRRAGFAFGQEPTELFVDDLTGDQLEQILGDALLSVYFR